jgi:selenoprotein W-related protein
MSELREAFLKGLTYDEHKARAANREALEAQERAIEIYASDLLPLKSLPAPLSALAIVDGAEDAATYLPVLGRLASDSGMLSVRVLSRGESADLMRVLGIADVPASLPAFVLFDQSFEEVGRLVGPRAGVDDAIRELVAIVKQHSARLRAARRLSPPPAAKPTHPVKVAITYCASCGYEPQTIELVQALMLRSRFDLSSIEIIVGEEGAFEVTVGGELVHSMYRDGGFPEPEKVIEAVRAHVVG